jgi:hypothetical protein
MSPLLDVALVAIALAASVVYALCSLGPKSLRARICTTLADFAARAPATLHLGRVERRLRAAAGASAACGGCDGCAPAPDAARETDGNEIRVPVASIGRRRVGS